MRKRRKRVRKRRPRGPRPLPTSIEGRKKLGADRMILSPRARWIIDENERLGEDRSDFQEMMDAVIPHTAHFIYADTPIIGGVSAKWGRETIYVNSDSKYLLSLYQEAYYNSTFDELSILDAVYDTVLKHFNPKLASRRERTLKRSIRSETIREAKRRLVVSLDFFLDRSSGVCRHMALTCCALIEMFIDEGLLSGHVSADRSKPAHTFNLAHMWCRYVDSNRTIWILDPMHKFNDSLETAYDEYLRALKVGRKRLPWSYWRVEDLRWYLPKFHTEELPIRKNLL